MRLAIIFAAAAYIALFIQTVVPLWIPLRWLVPNLIVILTVDLALRHQGIVPAFLAFAIGYATDAFSGSQPGLYAFLTTLIFVLTHYLSSGFLVSNAAVGVFAVFAGSVIMSVGAIVLSSWQSAGINIGLALDGILLQAVISALVAPVIFGALSSTKNLIGLPARPQRE